MFCNMTLHSNCEKILQRTITFSVMLDWLSVTRGNLTIYHTSDCLAVVKKEADCVRRALDGCSGAVDWRFVWPSARTNIDTCVGSNLEILALATV